MPHSALPVIGSTGTRRRNRTCRIRSCPWLEPLFWPCPEVCPKELPPAELLPKELPPKPLFPKELVPKVLPNPLDGAIGCPGFVAPAMPAPCCDVRSTPLTSVSRSGG